MTPTNKVFLEYVRDRFRPVAGTAALIAEIDKVLAAYVDKAGDGECFTCGHPRAEHQVYTLGPGELCAHQGGHGGCRCAHFRPAGVDRTVE